jgi:hypothetical protein
MSNGWRPEVSSFDPGPAHTCPNPFDDEDPFQLGIGLDDDDDGPSHQRPRPGPSGSYHARHPLEGGASRTYVDLDRGLDSTLKWPIAHQRN